MKLKNRVEGCFPHGALRAVAASGSAAVGRTVLAAVFLFLLALSSVSATEPKRVLIVHSFGTVAPPFTIHSTAFETELVAKMEGRVDLDEVSLDMARYADPYLQDALVDYLEKRQAQWHPDLVVPIGSPAGVFVAQHRQRLFPDVPVVYCGMDHRRLPPAELTNNAAFVGEDFDLAGFVKDILEIAPGTKNIAVVNGASKLEKYWTEAFRKAFQPFANRINFIWLDDLPFDQMLERVSKLPPHSAIFLILLVRDAAGVSHNADEALRRMRRVANAPIYSIFEHQLGLGIVGGRLYQAETEGIEAARVAARILHGEAISAFPPRFVGTLPPHYDWRELRRWHIAEKQLPADSTILFRTPTLWERHRNWLILGASLFVLQALLIFGLLVNLIRRHRAERSLAESEARFRIAADAAPVLMWMSGPDKLCTFFNKAWIEFTGRPMEEQLGDFWSEGVHPEDLDKCLTTYRRAFDARKPFTMQYRLRRHDGEYRWITDEGVPRFDPKRQFIGYVGTCVDVSNLLQKERELKKSEERVTLAAESAHLGVWEWDIGTDKVWLSDQARKLFQFKGETEITYAIWSDRIHPEDRATREQAIRRAVDTHSGYEAEYRILLPDQTVRWIAGRGRYLINPDTKRGRLLGVSVDVTERKLAEEQAQHHREEINRLSRIALLGEMTASIAHEVNQPLTAIVNNADAGQCCIDEGDVKLHMLREMFVDIAADGQRAHDVISNIRNTIKKVATVRESVDLNSLVKKIAHMFQPDMAAHACELETSLDRDLPMIEADPVQIHQVLINLVSNAVDAMHGTAPVRRKVQITTKRNGNGSIQLDVRDNGTGIPDELRERLFDEFFTTKEKGLGMGLAIVRSIVEAHNGTIEAENLKGGGARFCLTLPISQEIAQ